MGRNTAREMRKENTQGNKMWIFFYFIACHLYLLPWRLQYFVYFSIYIRCSTQRRSEGGEGCHQTCRYVDMSSRDSVERQVVKNFPILFYF